VKRLKLTRGEFETLREMGVFHDHARTRMRAQAIVRLSQGLTLQQVADEFGVHLNSVDICQSYNLRRYDRCWLNGRPRGMALAQ
jgi:hypothetical protein